MKRLADEWPRFYTDTCNNQFGVPISERELLTEIPLSQAIDMRRRGLHREEADYRTKIQLAGEEVPPQQIFLPEELNGDTPEEHSKSSAMQQAIHISRNMARK